MKDSAPNSLNFIGNIELLDRVCIGICGSRKAKSACLKVAKDCAGQIARTGLTVVSGNANGIDIEAHYNCLREGGETIFVLPEGLDHFKIRNNLQAVWNWERVLVVSQFSKDTRWHVHNAMARNMLIVALSRAIIVVQAGERGGSIDTGLKAVRKNVPVFAVQYQDSNIARGNQVLFDQSKCVGRIKKCKSTNQAILTEVFAVARNDRIMSNLV